ncbi:hypothetical protein D3C75_1319770 [compost metagenome]
MKKTKRPTRRQKTILKSLRLNPINWLVERDTPKEMIIVHRTSGNTKSIQRAGLFI